MNIRIRTVVQLFAYYILPAIIVGNAIIHLSGVFIEHSTRELGNYAFFLLIVILMIKPLCVLFPAKYSKFNIFKKILPFRRELGVLAFWIAITHSIGMIYLYVLENYGSLLVMFDPAQTMLFTGFIAFIGMFILGITSNKLSTKLLKTNWKKLQMLAYPTLIFAVVHKSLAEHGEMGAYVLLGIYTILKGFEIYKLKKDKKTKQECEEITSTPSPL